MNTSELKELVDLYIDKELEKNREPLLFSSLAGNEEAREYFFNLNVLRSYVEKDMQALPSAVEERIFNSIKEKNPVPDYFWNRTFLYISAAAAAVFIIISSFLFNEISTYKFQISSISEQINIQNSTIDLILNNSLPQAEVRSRSLNEVIVRANL